MSFREASRTKGFASLLDADSRAQLERHDAHIRAFEKRHVLTDIDAAIEILRSLVSSAMPVEARAFTKALLADRIQYYRYNTTHQLADLEEVLRLFGELEGDPNSNVEGTLVGAAMAAALVEHGRRSGRSDEVSDGLERYRNLAERPYES